MTKIEQIFIRYNIHPSDLHLDELIAVDIVEMMKEYAEYYAQKCLEVAAENVRFQYGDIDVEGSAHKEIVDLDYEKTFGFKLPEHE